MIAQQRLGSDWAEAHSDQSLLGMSLTFCGLGSLLVSYQGQSLLLQHLVLSQEHLSIGLFLSVKL